MKSRFFIVVLAVFLIFSCDHFVNLGDKSADGADYTEGLPDEIYEGENSDSADNGNYDDWNEDSAADTDAYDEGDNAGAPEAEPTDSWNDDDLPGADSDSNDDAEIPDEDGEVYVFPESDPFPEGFSNAGCGCGNAPDYLPVCCDGKISVFNACFANCYAVKSGNKICTSYETGLCGGAEITRGLTEGDGEETEQPDADEYNENDDDAELPDEDAEPAEIPNECGCYPEDEATIFYCSESFYFFITECLATCHCENPHELFF
ncbi:hypothetical protein J6253_03520 [bacterium]|nr:hypothetical protein [bacterium]